MVKLGDFWRGSDINTDRQDKKHPLKICFLRVASSSFAGLVGLEEPTLAAQTPMIGKDRAILKYLG
jgi:hypothetical protein